MDQLTRIGRKGNNQPETEKETPAMMTPEEIEALRHWSVSNQDEGSDMFIADLNRILTEISGRPEFLGLAYEIEAVLDAITGPQGPQEPS